MKAINDVAFFALELAALTAFGVWGWSIGSDGWRYVLAASLPLMVAIAWGVLAAPNAARRLDDPHLLMFQLAVFLLGAVALIAADRLVTGIVLAVLAVLVVPLDRVLTS